ncbi:cytochrome c oxidase assembly protein [Microbacterium sp. LRZ72]|uniref:cytochrome c oxidase assembly protein n=1 Tax=Microbacterium sp. LRZ72 TaxID=2942481 RepID=UPI0029BDE24F|nr:cytochrome c oxidase assembly protein [Microbacterium sp. LRZ72]MDX2377265.1 cytochrome c oxidase assembly protein [Microbacterium sp. LRZ72]
MDFALSPALLRADAVGLAVTVVGGGAYAVGAARLRARGDAWPAARSICFFLGVLAVFAVTCTTLGAWAMSLFSVHMLQHMVLNMVAPVLLVLGAPITLAMRALPARPRRVLVDALHSRPARVVTHPLLVTVVFTGSLFALYFTPLFGLAMGSHVGHLAMQVHFLVSGYLMFWLLVGIDPGPRRREEVARMPVVLALVVTHTAFAFVVVFTSVVIGADYFATVRAPWPVDARADQALAGGIAWGLGELSSAVIVVVLFLQWFARAERREAAERRAEARAAVR